MIWLYGIMTAAGWLLAGWALGVNPYGSNPPDIIAPLHLRVRSGPYRFLRHPMYVGEWMAAVGMAGLAAGLWNAMAVGLVAELLLREWAMREES
jgi:protein-S-isoprenylcysteine O-methyltransferase Ste14